jgi:GGDEF domain-containing protein
MSEIFVSHASSDVKLVGAISDLIELGIGAKVFCSSVPGQGVEPGVDFKSHIQKRLANCSLALAVVTPHFYKSEFCLCETGAVWALSRTFVPLVAPPLGTGDLRAVLAGLQGVRLDSEEQLDQLRDLIANEQESKIKAVAQWNHHKRAFIERLPELYRDISPERARGEVFLREYLSDFVVALRRMDVHLVLVDIDGQGQINRKFGVEFGNSVLERVPSLLRDDHVVRCAGRCGDDTFFAICVGDLVKVGKYAINCLAAIKATLSTEAVHVTATACVVPKTNVVQEGSWVGAASTALRAAQRDCKGSVLVVSDLVSATPDWSFS